LRLDLYKDELQPVIESAKAEMGKSDRDNIERLLEKLRKSNSQAYLLFEKIIYWMFFHFAGHGEVYDSGYFKEFFSKTRPGDCIISFNYDLLLEWALRDSGIQYTYNWSDTRKVRILKPHGAINFITNLDENSDVRVKHLDGNVSKHKARQVFTRLSEYFGCNIGHGVWDIFNNKLGISHFYWDQFNIKGKQSFLILPELNKDDVLKRSDYQFLKLTWEHIPDVLISFHELWVIGYNFSESDKKAVDTIGTYLKNTNRRVYVIDPEPKSPYLKELCAKSHVKHFALKFKKFLASEKSI
ncbi:MAG: hypothetical protein GXY83_28885, partial [Rhodopirellula sp.]|nr:hypothetical protein [Rhodopirellula sp.]